MNRNLQEAKNKIAGLNLLPYVTKAVMNGKLRTRDTVQAEKEYRHFLLLVFVNTSVESTEWVVPTERADQVWHEHLLDSANYRMCCDDVFGRFIDHYPGLEKGTASFKKATKHTEAVHESLGGRDSGFVPVYAVCAATHMPGLSSSYPANHDTGHSPSSHSTSSHSSSSDSGGHGASCGGAGCGGGG